MAQDKEINIPDGEAPDGGLETPLNAGKVILYSHKSPEIKITVEAYFENGSLIIDGYDIGSQVEDVWGDSDYEYVTELSPPEVKKLYPLFGIKNGDKKGLLRAISQKYNTNTCYSDFNKLLSDNGIKSGGFTWT